MVLFLVKIKTNDCLFQKRGHAEPRWLQQLPTSCCPPVKSLWIPPSSESKASSDGLLLTTDTLFPFLPHMTGFHAAF